VQVYNLLGEIIYDDVVSQKSISINSEDWKPGVYFLKSTINTNLTITKIIKR